MLRPVLYFRVVSICVRTRVRWICSSWTSRDKQENNSEQESYSFAKDLFLGSFNVRILQHSHTQNSENLERQLLLIKDYFQAKVKCDDIDEKSSISKKVKDDISQLGLFGLRVPAQYGGMMLTARQYAEVKESTALSSSICDMLYGHEALGVQAIVIHGGEEQKRKYLPKLAKGASVAALCLSESDFGSDLQAVTTQACLSADGTAWILNGRKKWVLNGPIADVFIVLAVTGEHWHTLFIVEKCFGGIKIREPVQKLGKQASEICEVEFSDTPVPVGNVLGHVGEGIPLAMEISVGDDFASGSATASVLRKLVKFVTEHYRKKLSLGIPPMSKLRAQIVFAEVSRAIYVLESMTYVTAGILDDNLNPDCYLEAMMTKVFSSETLFHCVNQLQTVLANNAFVEGSEYEKLFRASWTMMSAAGGMKNLRMLIALSGLVHAGNFYQETSMKQSLLMIPMFFFRNFLEHMNDLKDRPKLVLGLKELVHPSLEVPAVQLEYSVQRLRFITKFLMSSNEDEGRGELDLCRLADVAIKVFAMAAVLTRASQSCVRTLWDSDIEVIIAKGFCSRALRDIKQMQQIILGGPPLTGDMEFLKVSSKIITPPGCHAHHPLVQKLRNQKT